MELVEDAAAHKGMPSRHGLVHM